MISVLTKLQNYRLWQSGAFGNKLRAWHGQSELIRGGYRGPLAVRTLLSGGGSGPCHYNCTFIEAAAFYGKWRVRGIADEAIMFNEMAPNAEVLQGEFFNGVLQDEEGFALSGYFFYSTLRRPMRDALRERGEHTFGLRADIMLREAMTSSSYEDWRVLLDQYPNHVLEVSIYDRCLGNTLQAAMRLSGK